MLGSTLGNYRIERELGRGGMGAVYVGTHALLGRTAAIKVLLPKYSQDQDIVQRFFNEARAATAIKHPGIVEIYDFGHAADGAAYIVMELCEGESLAKRMRRPMPIATALTIARQIAGTLAAAHRAGIVHRDLKPDNVFVVPDPEVAGGERIKLLDFGIAKLATDAAGPTKTSTGVIMGTPNYMSPEQCRGAGQVDHRSDLYSLGCILFELVCGRVPFVGEGAGDIISSHLLIAPPSPRSLAPNLPADIEQLVLQLLAKKPADRPADADAVIDTLQRLGATISPTLESGIRRVESGIAPTLPSDRGVDGMAVTAASTPPTPAYRAKANRGTEVERTQLDPEPPKPAPTTLSGAAGEAAPKRRRTIGFAIGAAALVGTIAIVARLGATGDGDRPAGGVASGSQPLTGLIAEPDAAVDDRPLLVIGLLGGHELTDGMRDRIRPYIAKLLEKVAPELRPVLVPTATDASAKRALFLDGTLTTLENDAGSVRCKFKFLLATYPDKAIVDSINGGASVGVGKSFKEIESAVVDCVDAAVEDTVTKKMLPEVREKLGIAAHPKKDLDQAGIAEIIHATMPQFQDCYVAALKLDPTIAARVATSFTIGTDGQVSKETATGTNAQLAACVKTALRSMTFPAPAEPMTINYPLRFKLAESGK